jgi:replicative DNA helicase
VTQRRSARDILAGLDADRRLAVLHGEDASQPQGWDADPTPLTPRRLVPPFPVDALPPWVADMVLAVAEFTQTPLDLPGCLALAALSTAAGGCAELEVRPGWREPLNLYTVVAMPPGSRKSAVFAAMTAPLLDAERQLVEKARPRIADWREFIRKRRESELDALIAAEALKADEARSFVADAFRDGAVPTTGTAVTKILPPASRFSKKNNHADKKQRVLGKLVDFFERYAGLA